MGRLLDIVKMFAQAQVHVVALSILDTADAAIVRLVTDDPDKARALFQEHGLAQAAAGDVERVDGGSFGAQHTPAALVPNPFRLPVVDEREDEKEEKDVEEQQNESDFGAHESQRSRAEAAGPGAGRLGAMTEGGREAEGGMDSAPAGPVDNQAEQPGDAGQDEQ